VDLAAFGGKRALQTQFGISLRDPEQHRSVGATNFDDASAVHQYAETVLAVPCAIKFKVDVRRAVTFERVGSARASNRSVSVRLGLYFRRRDFGN
jgi:hypothetical protein